MDKSNGRRLKDSTGLILLLVNYSLFVHKHQALIYHLQSCGKNTRQYLKKTSGKLYLSIGKATPVFPFFAPNKPLT
jgi:hypothetical protein